MTMFDERKDAAENEFAYRQLETFKKLIRQYKQVGLDVAAKIGLSGAEAEKYAMDGVEFYLTKRSVGCLAKRFSEDLQKKGIASNEEEMLHVLDDERK